VTAWSKAVRDAMLKGGAEFQRQKVLNRAAGNWSKDFLRTTDIGLARIRQVACTGIKFDFMTRQHTLGVGMYARVKASQVALTQLPTCHARNNRNNRRTIRPSKPPFGFCTPGSRCLFSNKHSKPPFGFCTPGSQVRVGTDSKISR
jgi:hypothetical protein